MAVPKHDKDASQEEPSNPETGGKPDSGLHIVGMGASAGGLEAFAQFFRHVPANTGMAFVLVSHLDPDHASMLTEILQRTTKMRVVEAVDQVAVEPDHVYVIPPNRDMGIFHGSLQLRIPEGPRGLRMPIDSFLRSLAEDQGESAICVVLSGTGTDGTLGMRAIHGAGGVSFVQEPSTAKYDGMPVSAIGSGLATYVLTVEKMPEQLMAYVANFRTRNVDLTSAAPAVSGLNRILHVVRSRTGHDFGLYKRSTIQRRIERRILVHGIENLGAYTRYLQEHPEEIHLLFRELVINVTSFFRDADAFTGLSNDILPRLFDQKSSNHVFRVWVPACSTGEEAYSIAISFREYMSRIGREFKVQIYGTDIEDHGIAKARVGAYPPNIAIDVSPDRLRRFFLKEETCYRIKKDIREMVVFAAQNAIKDPPFTKLDLVSCRNLLIYLEPELQSRLIQALHYALRPGGVLFLSPSEGIGNHIDLFTPIDKKWKFFQARVSRASRKAIVEGMSLAGELPGVRRDDAVRRPREKDRDVADVARRVLLQSFAPPSVVTDERGNLLYVHGDTGKYLRPAPGEASLNVIDMARDGLQLEMRSALNAASAEKKTVILQDLEVRTNGEIQTVTLTVKPLYEAEPSGGLLMIVCFQDTAPPEKKVVRRKRSSPDQTKREEELEHELLYTRENLQATVEEVQASNEELKSINEEMQSTNEELQSTNEELETSKEELQSVNEELVTVNAELQEKIEQLAGMQNDMKNLLDSTNIGTIFLDERMAIKQFTREAAKVFRILPADVGRPLGDIKSNIDAEDLLAGAQTVLDSLLPSEKEYQTPRGEWYMVRTLPYRTLDNAIEGVVLTFVDITALKRVESLRESQKFAESIVDAVREPLVVLDGEFKVISASRSFYRTFSVVPEDTVGHNLRELGAGQWDIPKLRELLEAIVTRDSSFEDLAVEHTFPAIGRRKMLLNARRIPGEGARTQMILLAMEDITARPSAS